MSERFVGGGCALSNMQQVDSEQNRTTHLAGGGAHSDRAGRAGGRLGARVSASVVAFRYGLRRAYARVTGNNQMH
jgi:hypothetical protein